MSKEDGPLVLPSGSAEPLVALDCDGLLSDWLGGCLDAIFEVTGKRYQRQEVRGWSPWMQFKLSPDQTTQVFEILNTPGFCESLEVLPGAKKGYDALVKVADVIVVTSPWLSAPTWPFERLKWLSTHFGIGPEKLIHTSAKEFVSADFFVDDHKPNVQRWLERNNGIGLLWDCSHNQGSDLPRVRSWDELVSIVRGDEGVAA
jgi:5'(3')-deoxyribonucleotidase